MKIDEMHVWFRQYAQQMGMQNVRAILPEQIDLLINTSISDIINSIIKENIGITNDRVVTDNSKIGQINCLKTLYKVSELYMPPVECSQPIEPTITITSINESSDSEDITDPSLPIVKPIEGYFGFNKNWCNSGKISSAADNLLDRINPLPEHLFIVDFSLSYKKCKKGYSGKIGGRVPTFDEDAEETIYFPVRFIDDIYLADTLNDFILKPRLRSPIIVTHDNIFDLYIDKFVKDSDNTYKLTKNLLPYHLRFSYIAKPCEVQYNEDLLDKNIHCDLPEFMHVDILKHAVDLWRSAISGSILAAQNQERVARQENIRNNYANNGNQ